MNAFEKIIMGILAVAPAEIPIFVHSPGAIAIVNASEILIGSILQQFAPKSTPVANAQTLPVANA
jgi:hypothetical protein